MLFDEVRGRVQMREEGRERTGEADGGANVDQVVDVEPAQRSRGVRVDIKSCKPISDVSSRADTLEK
jgi:hypothetical protein